MRFDKPNHPLQNIIIIDKVRNEKIKIIYPLYRTKNMLKVIDK